MAVPFINIGIKLKSQVKNNIYNIKCIFIATVQPCLFILQQFFTSLLLFFNNVSSRVHVCVCVKQIRCSVAIVAVNHKCLPKSNIPFSKDFRVVSKMFSFLNNRKYILRNYCPVSGWLGLEKTVLKI